MNPNVEIIRGVVADSRHDWDYDNITGNEERWVCESMGYCITLRHRPEYILSGFSRQHLKNRKGI